MEDQIAHRMAFVREFDESKAGVKGLSDSGIQKLPPIFVRPPKELSEELTHEKSQSRPPVIDLDGLQDIDKRRRIVEEVRNASETWGFFQVVNHGIPQNVLDGMIDGIREFNEQDVEAKKEYYSRDTSQKVRYTGSYDLFTAKTASWKDTLTIPCPDSEEEFDRDKLPPPCRESTLEYSKDVKVLGNALLGVLSEALGLKTNHLENMECSKGHRLHCHYYPACPEPDLAIGLDPHSDPVFLTILLQSQSISALQLLHQGQWVDVEPIPGSLEVNIGDLLQLVSNGKFKSTKHRVIANRVGPRISVPCFFAGPSLTNLAKVYGVIEELVSEENPAAYKQVVLGEFREKFMKVVKKESDFILDYYKV